MLIAMAQMNSVMGDFEGNAKKALDFIKRAGDKNCELVLFPELALFGYWPSDLLERSSVVDAQLKYLDWLHKRIPKGMGVLIGGVSHSKSKELKAYKNTAFFLEKDRKVKHFYKELLPNYDVFDETRHFSEGDLDDNILTFKSKKFLVTICEDIWPWGEAWIGTEYVHNPFKKLKNKKLDVILNLSASPFSTRKEERRLSVVQQTAKYLKCPLIYTNIVGGQDELIFDGGSIAVDSKGNLIAKSSYFSEDLNIVDTENLNGGFRQDIFSQKLPKEFRRNEFHRQALVQGIRDFVYKNGLDQVHLGLSGGIDSAVVACLAVDALGPGNVTCIAMPSEFNANESLDLAKSLSENLGCKFKVLPIQSSYEQSLNAFQDVFGNEEFSLMNENLQARQRGMFLMAFSNRFNSLLLATSNKSEYATGYSTLYGDMCGGLAPIGDLLKTEVYALARHYNSEFELIPERIISRPPSAELRPNQKDQDSLPEYLQLDKSIHKIVVECKEVRTKVDKFVMNKLVASEFKRWQAAPILRISNHAFGIGRRFPITNKSKY